MTQSPGDTTPLSELNAVSPVDGRYARHTAPLRRICSELGLMRYRVVVEVRWLEALGAENSITELPAFDDSATGILEGLLRSFDETEAAKIKQLEATTNHDVKAVEYYLREYFAEHRTLDAAIPFIHFACTSEDINNLAYGMMLIDARAEVLLPAMNELLSGLASLSTAHASDSMLSRTHGQPASPTTMGKEMANFAVRLRRQIDALEQVALLGKMNGAVGNYNAHLAAYPHVDWPRLSERFVVSLGLGWNSHTTQIEPHDCIAEFADALARTNTIFMDLCRDIWSYISIGYFRQHHLDDEVGSSSMPHKVNPIDFENAEGNLGVANALLNHFARKLPLSRMQRDLTDSTVLRNLGSALAYSVIAYQSLLKGLGKLEIDQDRLASDLDHAWEVLAEPIQTVMRRHGVSDSYEQLKKLTRGQRSDRESLGKIIDGLALPTDAKRALKALTPADYIGHAAALAKDV
ncbi:MAG: adenylosuccinate lyase [Proteobacteria bacterium]|nr:adenylosuccinate lyase [Pseudomonadota bacterium]